MSNKNRPQNQPPQVNNPFQLETLAALFGDKTETKSITIHNIRDEEVQVSLRLPIGRAVLAGKPFKVLVDNFARTEIILPERRQGESLEGHNQRIGFEMLKQALSPIVGFISDDLINCAAVVMDVPPEEVSQNYELDQLVAVVVPFFARLLGKMLTAAAPTDLDPKSSSESLSGQ